MCQRNRFLLFGLLSLAAMLVMVEKSSAQLLGFRRNVVRRPLFPANRMPGWDWRRIYPWSPYNYGRNPYNPIILPYAYPQPYPVFTPVDGPQGFATQGPATAPAQQEEIPHPTGAINTPPANAALIEIQVPTEFAQVSFDNEASSSTGTKRYYVTPDLPAGKECHYDIKATWNVNGQAVTKERKIAVQPGQTTKVDFTKPEPTK